MADPILLLTTVLRPGGAERIVYELATRLDRERFSPIVAALDGRGEYAGRLQKAGVEVIDLEAYSRTDLGVIGRLWRVLGERSIQLLHSHLFHANIIARLAARRLRIPVVSTCHIVERRWRPWHFCLDRWTARWCRCEVCVSKAVKTYQQSRTGLPDDFFRVIPNGIDLLRFASPLEKQAARAALNIPEEGIVLGCLGRLETQKGFDLALHAMRRIQARRDNSQPLCLVVAGDGSQAGALRELAQRLEIADHVIWLGHVEAERVLPAFDILLCPSRWEGLPLVALEGMAAGCAVVATQTDAYPEIITPGKTGLLVPPEDPESLADAALHLIDQERARQQLGRGAREAASAFSIEQMVGHYEQCYAEHLR